MPRWSSNNCYATVQCMLELDGYGKCKKLGKSPDIYREAIRQDCPEAMLDTKIFTLSRLIKLYPEAAK